MIKNWQSMQDYRLFLTNSKVSFDSSEWSRLHSERWEPWEKLRSFNTDADMEYFQHFYPSVGRPAYLCRAHQQPDPE